MSAVAYCILPLYFAITVAIGWFSRRDNSSDGSFLNASRSLPLPIVVCAYLAANCGALEVVGLSALAAQYGALAFHFYWIGAIPAMIFLALWMMPIFRSSGIRSVPQYLNERFGPDVRLLNACVVALSMLLLGGVSLYAIAQVLSAVFHWEFVASIALTCGVVLFYTLLGGIRATIYNEVFQLAVMLAGLLPLAFRSVSAAHLFTAESMARNHLWANIPLARTSARMDGVGIVVGLGFVLSFGYWCTDFVLMQRAFTARTESEAREVPLWAGLGKLLFALIVVLPGMAAYRLFPALGHTQRFDQALPALMLRLYGPVMLNLGLTALTASLMSGLAANVSGFAALWTEEIYSGHLRTGQSNQHYLQMARWSTVCAVLLSAAASYLTFLFGSLMESVQMIFSLFVAPFWAVFVLGILSSRMRARGVIAGFVAGTVVAMLHLGATVGGVLHYGSLMSGNFYASIYAFAATILVALTVNRGEQAVPIASQALVFRGAVALEGKGVGKLWLLSFLLLAVFLAMNWWWR